MSLLKAYLSTPRAQRALKKKPGEQGFSLIELVVVVAVLAILSAIAIPSFTSINAKARSAAATQTIATVAKECAVKYAEGQAAPTFAAISLDGYASFTTISGGTSSTTACIQTGTINATSAAPATTIPTFSYNVVTGDKICVWGAAASAAADAAKVGCKNWAAAGTAGVW
jgi:type IV pilus assembly protein PilA